MEGLGLEEYFAVASQEYAIVTSDDAESRLYAVVPKRLLCR